jgi:hypothetical protein
MRKRDVSLPRPQFVMTERLLRERRYARVGVVVLVLGAFLQTVGALL